jgi:cytochrome c-type protein NapB
MTIKRRNYSTIMMIVALMICAITIIDISWMNSQESADLHFEKQDFSPSIPTEQGVFRRSEYAMGSEQIPSGENLGRSLEEYYKNRAYPGAPPTIPHALLSEEGIGASTCLQCHQNGGYVAKFSAYAPITPHPEMINCRQCHVPVTTTLEFSQTAWEKIAHPPIKNSAMQGSPPVIPHALQMRENCAACHSGPAAPQEISVSHPLRLNCRQCHVPVQDLSTLRIEWDSSAQFVRKPQ